MSNNLKNRLNRLEGATASNNEKWLCTFSQQYGLDGETIREESDDQVIAKHLADHPDDRGLKFNIINRVIIHSKTTDNEGSHV